MTTETVTLADFLLARIAEDEAVARAAIRFAGTADGVWVYTGRSSIVEATAELWDPPTLLPHIARHDPAHVLAECEAKRAIIVEMQTLAGISGRLTRDALRRGQVRPVEERAVAVHASYALALMAFAYADHPDYRQEWKP